MKQIQNKSYIEKMNKWGEERKPYIFIIDYEMLNPIVLPLNEAAENEIYFKLPNINCIDNQIFKSSKFIFKKFVGP